MGEAGPAFDFSIQAGHIAVNDGTMHAVPNLPSVCTNTWTHFAWQVDTAGKWSFAVNGVFYDLSSWTFSGRLHSTQPAGIWLGCILGNSFGTGALANFRISKTQRYTGNFTPSWKMPVDSNTVFSLGPSFKDVVTNAQLSVTGNVVFTPTQM